MEPVLKVALAAYRACAICGYKLRRDQPVWRIFTSDGRATMQSGYQDGTSSEYAAPGHLVCMLYSALVCPFWSNEHARLSKDSTMAPGAKRGEQAAVIGFDTHAFVVDPARPLGGPQSQPLSFLYRGFNTEILFDTPAELTDIYERERIRVGGSYIGHTRRHYAPQFGGKNRLVKEVNAAMRELQETEPIQRVVFDRADSFVYEPGWM